MSDYSKSNDDRLAEYCAIYCIDPVQRLGFGKDGTVWATTGATAIKVYDRVVAFEQEKAVYRRLAELGVSQVHGHAVPLFARVDDPLGVLEMTIVKRPFLLDFASAHLDTPPDFPAEVMDEWWARKRDDFGANWPATVAILRHLEKLGIYMTDVHPGNIGFAESGDRPTRVRGSSSSSPE